MTSKLRDLRFTGRAPSFIATPSESLPSPNDDNQHLHLEAQLQRFLIAKVLPSELFSQLSDGPDEIQRVGWEASRLICQAHSPAELTHSRTLVFTHSSSFLTDNTVANTLFHHGSTSAADAGAGAASRVLSATALPLACRVAVELRPPTAETNSNRRSLVPARVAVRNVSLRCQSRRRSYAACYDRISCICAKSCSAAAVCYTLHQRTHDAWPESSRCETELDTSNSTSSTTPTAHTPIYQLDYDTCPCAYAWPVDASNSRSWCHGSSAKASRTTDQRLRIRCNRLACWHWYRSSS